MSKKEDGKHKQKQKLTKKEKKAQNHLKLLNGKGGGNNDMKVAPIAGNNYGQEYKKAAQQINFRYSSQRRFELLCDDLLKIKKLKN